MSAPLVLAYSHDSRFLDDMHVRCEGEFQLAGCSCLEDVLAACSAAAPTAFVGDFRSVHSGGHTEDQLLDLLERRFPEAVFLVALPAEAPEPIERRVACSSMLRLPAETTAADVMDQLRCLLAPVQNTGAEHGSQQNAPAQPPVAVSSAADQPALSAARARRPETGRSADSDRSDNKSPHGTRTLSGITRRFETSTPRMQRMLADLEIAAKHNVTILLIGETGSGKTFLSRLIHEVSPRRDEPFVTVACGALPSDLIESELFGHMKGSFTSAHADKEGKFVAARRGSLLLDEIDVLAPEQQVKLLRVIETGEFEPVGGNQTLHSEARLVVASNLDLQPLVEQGRFRPDLYYRLNMLKFEVLPLRERRLDIPLLADRFVEQLCRKHGTAITEIDPAVMEAFMSYPWPGNVRELENVIQRAVIYANGGHLKMEHLPANIVSGTAGPANDPSVRFDSSSSSSQDGNSLGEQIALTEREIIEQTLFRNNFSRTNTAKELGISRVTLYNKMKKYDMSR